MSIKRVTVSGLILVAAILFSGCSTTRYASAPRGAADAMVCNRCNGVGKVQTCNRCEGSGSTTEVQTTYRTQQVGHGVYAQFITVPVLQSCSVPCRTCAGHGVLACETGRYTCDRCIGTGRVYLVDSAGNKRPPRPKEKPRSLLDASFEGEEDAARMFLNRGDLVDATNSAGMTPLMWAVTKGHTNVVQLLLAHGANIQTCSTNGMTPLLFAAAEGRVEIARLLLDKGAAIEATNVFGVTPLLCASFKGQTAVAELLIARGANINARSTGGGVPLSEAAFAGNTNIVKMLLDKGALIDVPSNAGMTPLMWAANKGHVAVAEMLIAYGADVNAKPGISGSPLLEAAFGGNVDIAKLLLDKGVNIDATNNAGMTPLMWAANKGHIKVAELLVARGASLALKSKDGLTPHMWANRNRHLDVAKLLTVPHREAAEEATRTPLSEMSTVVRDYLAAAGKLDVSLTRSFLSGSCNQDIITEFKAKAAAGWEFSPHDSRIGDEKISDDKSSGTVEVNMVFKGGNPPTFMETARTFSLMSEKGILKITGMNPPPMDSSLGVRPL